MSIDRKHRAARVWSNAELRRVAPMMMGRVANVSGADDLDKEGGHYVDYFVNASSYTLTNHSSSFRGFAGRPGEIALDLTAVLSDDLLDTFDVVFNHTTLEHIFELERAFGNLCAMATQYVIVVVPFAQVEHGPPAFGDYWRFTPMAMEELFRRQGWYPAYLAASPMKDAACYLFVVGASSEALAARLPPSPKRPVPLGDWIGAERSGLLARLLRVARSRGAAILRRAR